VREVDVEAVDADAAEFVELNARGVDAGQQTPLAERVARSAKIGPQTSCATGTPSRS